jgi:2-hydroxy-3-oxopropionate reductase
MLLLFRAKFRILEDERMETIGFIGLGIMGKPMCRNLMKAGYKTVVYDVVPAALAELAADGAKAAKSPADVASQVEKIITMLPDSPQVRQVIMGPSGVLEGARKGTIIIDMSSIAPSTSKEVCEAAKAKGVRMLDAPVSGGQPGAVAATLSIMVGGEKADFDECYDLMKLMGKSVVLVGSIGAGNTVKLCNQIIVALNIAALGEALTLGVKAGVDPEAIFDAIKGGLAGSNVMNAKTPMVLDRNFNPGFRIDLHIKDIANALQTGKEIGAPLPLTGLVAQIMQAVKVKGLGGSDHSAIVQFFESLADVEIERVKH